MVPVTEPRVLERPEHLPGHRPVLYSVLLSIVSIHEEERKVPGCNLLLGVGNAHSGYIRHNHAVYAPARV